MWVLVEDGARAPLGQGPRRAAVAVVGGIPGQIRGPIDGHDVGGMARRAVLLGVVEGRGGGCDHVGEVADGGRVVAQGAERADLGHSTLRWSAGTPKGLGTASSYDSGRARACEPVLAQLSGGARRPCCDPAASSIGVAVFLTPLERHPIRSIWRFAALLGLLSVLLFPAAAPVAAVDGLTMEAETLLAGHARIGSWMAVSVRLTNDGPPISGELRLGGAQGTSRYGIAVDLPTQSDKTYVLHAQPPTFGRELEVTLVDGTTTIATQTVPYSIHETNQLIVGVIAERPQDLVSAIDLFRTRTRSSRSSSRWRSPTSRSASRPGRPSIASSGRTSTAAP